MQAWGWPRAKSAKQFCEAGKEIRLSRIDKDPTSKRKRLGHFPQISVIILNVVEYSLTHKERNMLDPWRWEAVRLIGGQNSAGCGRYVVVGEDPVNRSWESCWTETVRTALLALVLRSLQ